MGKLTDTTPDPITTAREALNRACRVPQQYPSRDDLFALQTVIDLAEKLKAERDAAKDGALKDIISKDVVESIQALYGATKMENTRLTSQLDLYKAALEKVEEWWLETGMKGSTIGAPYCMFAVRRVLAQAKGEG